MGFNWVRFTNWVILISTVFLGITGGAGLFWTSHPWIFDLHRAAGWLLIAAVPPKTIIIYRSLKRGFRITFEQGLIKILSVFLTATSLLVIALGIVWMWRLAAEEAWLRQTVISWHWMIGLGLLAPFLLHVWKRWQKPKGIDFRSRRGAIRLIGLGLISVAFWGISERIARQKSTLTSDRRFSGSHEKSSFSGNGFPVTNNPGEGGSPIDINQWKLMIEYPYPMKAEYSYSDLLKMESIETTATVDCTLGWFSTQVWRGIPLSHFLHLDQQARQDRLGVVIESISGYSHAFPISEAAGILLATHVGDQPLDHWHGYPLRAVVPGRRGWFWVKWITKIIIVPL